MRRGGFLQLSDTREASPFSVEIQSILPTGSCIINLK